MARLDGQITFALRHSCCDAPSPVVAIERDHDRFDKRCLALLVVFDNQGDTFGIEAILALEPAKPAADGVQIHVAVTSVDPARVHIIRSQGIESVIDRIPQ